MNIKRGKFIVIEGIDGCGKSTQLNLLVERFKKETNKKLMIADFPRYYDSDWGKLIGELLAGKYGNFIASDPHLTILPYMLDEYTWSRDIGRRWLQKGRWILSNRFFTSNVHQIAKYKGIARKNFRDWSWRTGYDILGILKPDLVVFLDVPPHISSKMNLRKQERDYLKGKRQDLAERDANHQFSAYQEYLFTVKSNSFWTKVRCIDGGLIDRPESISSRIWSKVEKLL